MPNFLQVGVEGLIEKLLTNGSPLVVLVVVVWIFLRYLSESRKEDREVMSQMHQQHLEARSQMREALKENAEITKENTAALTGLKEVVLRWEAISAALKRIERHEKQQPHEPKP